MYCLKQRIASLVPSVKMVQESLKEFLYNLFPDTKSRLGKFVLLKWENLVLNALEFI